MNDWSDADKRVVTEDLHELNVGSDGVALTEPHEEPSVSRVQLRLYVSTILLAPFVFFAGCLMIMRSDAFMHHTQNAYVANMGYGLTLHNTDCEVLVYGDSSAMIGIDPDTVTGLTHKSVCNIADFVGMLRLNGTMVLDTYLANNPRPRYLVILLAPEDLGPLWRDDGNFEAFLMRIRRKPDGQLLRVIWQHPESTLSAIGISGRFASTWLFRKPLDASIWRERARTHGRFPDPKPAPLVCPPEARVSPPDRAWIKHLRDTYGINGTKVLVDVMPVPPCDPALPVYLAELPTGSGLIDNKLHTYPLAWYTTSGRLHPGPEGQAHLSREIADQIKGLEEKR